MTEVIIKDNEVKVYYSNKEYEIFEFADLLEMLNKTLQAAKAAEASLNNQ